MLNTDVVVLCGFEPLGHKGAPFVQHSVRGGKLTSFCSVLMQHAVNATSRNRSLSTGESKGSWHPDCCVLVSC